MRRERNRFWTVFAIATVVALAGIAIAMRWHRLFPTGEVSELYRAYMDTPGVDATFIRGFQVNDTVSVDVTLLQATDSAGWERLLSNVRIPEEMQELIELWKQRKHVMLHGFPKSRINDSTDSVFINNDLLAIDWAEQTLAIFHITDKKQSKAIIGYHLDNLKPNKKQQE